MRFKYLTKLFAYLKLIHVADKENDKMQHLKELRVEAGRYMIGKWNERSWDEHFYFK